MEVKKSYHLAGTTAIVTVNSKTDKKECVK